jgi:phenylpropionate dioxygenase-like ring-hydroxylating dioxygenase large terminal subunit
MNQMLSDGSHISDLIDYQNREIHQRVLNDPEIHRIEMERIFAHTWNILGHTSEIPEVGDFVTRQIGEEPVIVSRGRDNQVLCVLNACAHRGATVCREDAGNTSVYRCIYHGWIYNLDGSFRGAPFQEQLFPKACDTANFALKRARVTVFCDIIFATWDQDAPSLEDYLGDFAWYLKGIFGRCDYRVVGPPHRFVQKANWKTVTEQFAGDAYHASQLHRSLADLLPMDNTDPDRWSLRDPKVGTDEGHTSLCFDQAERIRRAAKGDGRDLTAIERLNILPPPGMTAEQVPEMVKRFTEEELELLSTNPPSQCAIFPNAAIWSNSAPLPDGKTFTSYLSLRVHLPCGPDKFQFMVWGFVAKDASEEYCESVRQVASFCQGATGFVEMDDAEVWPGMTSVARGPVGGTNKLRYPFIGKIDKPANWPAGGHVYTGYSSDDTQWIWWARYFDFLEGKAKGFAK